MDARLTVTTANGDLYFFTTCNYQYNKNDSAQISFVYEGDFRKYNMVIGLNRDKIAFTKTDVDPVGYAETSFNILTLGRGAGVKHAAVEVEYLKFNFSSDDVLIDYKEDFAHIVLPCNYQKVSQSPKPAVIKIICTVPQIKENI